MGLHGNAELLRDTLEAMPLFEGRFSNLKLMNLDPISGQRRGCFSLVFKGHDEVQQRSVALKFFDPNVMMDTYRIAAFRREHEILQGLIGSERCLQLVSPLGHFPLSHDVGGGKLITIMCEYFVVDWVDDEIDTYFLTNQHTTVEKLRLFNDMVLAVEALHSHQVFHRDLKADNMRAFRKAIRRVVIAIDLGTAARYDSGRLQASYGIPVGAPAYAAPEAICGLAGTRVIAPHSDYYALGCLLFELFNPDYFFSAVRRLNHNIDLRFAAMQGEMTGIHGEELQVGAWHTALGKFAGGVVSVPIDAPGSCVPKGIAGILNELLGALTHVDYRKRHHTHHWVRAKLRSATMMLENEAEYKRRLAIIRQRRQRREAAAAEKAVRLAKYQGLGDVNGNP